MIEAPRWYRMIAVVLFMGGLTIPLIPFFAVLGYYMGQRSGAQAQQPMPNPPLTFGKELALWSALAFGPFAGFMVADAYYPGIDQVALVLVPLWGLLGAWASLRLCAVCYLQGFHSGVGDLQ